MPKRKKGKGKKTARSVAAKSMLKESDIYPNMGAVMKSFDEREATRSKGPEEAPIREYASLGIPLWLAYYDDLVVAKEELGDGKRSPLMEPSRYLKEVAPLGYDQDKLPDLTKERKSRAMKRLESKDAFHPGNKDAAPAWFDMDIAKESFSSEVLPVPFTKAGHVSGRDAMNDRMRVRAKKRAMSKAMTDTYPTERFPKN
jgi:hypothetical protein